MSETVILVERAELAVLDQECCEPECGPNTCGPEVARVEAVERPQAQSRCQCCEPECGPDTCG